MQEAPHIEIKDLKAFEDIDLGRVIRFDELHGKYEIYTDDLSSKKVYTCSEGLDKLLGGIRPPQVASILSLPDGGKTAFLLNIIKKQSKIFRDKGKDIHLFSMEMGENDLTERTVQMELDTYSSTVEKKFESRDKLFMAQAQEALKQYDNVWAIIERIGWQQLKSYSMAISKITGRPAGLIMVDYTQLFLKGEKEGEYDMIANSMRGLQSTAVQMQIPIINCSQVSNEAIKNKIITIISGKGGGEINASSQILIALEPITEYKVSEFDEDMIRRIENQEFKAVRAKIIKKKQGRYGEQIMLLNLKNLTFSDYHKNESFIPGSIFPPPVEDKDKPF